MASFCRSTRVLAWWLVLSLALASGALAGEKQPAEPKQPAAKVKPPRLSKTPSKKVRAKAKAKSMAQGSESESGRQKRKEPKKAQPGEDETLVINLRHTSAQGMADHVKRLFRGPELVRTSADEPTNILLVRAQPSTLDQIRHMVTRLEDAAAASARHSQWAVRAFRVEFADAQRVADMIRELAPFSWHDPPPRVECDPRTNALLINASEGDWPAIETIIQAVDVRE